MSWGMVAGAVIGGVVSYAGQKSANKQSGKNAKNQGYVDTTTTRNPDPYSDPYRKASTDAAWNALTGTNPLSGGTAAPIKGDPNASPSGQRSAPPPGMRYNKAGKLVKPKNAGPATGSPDAPAAAKKAPFAGQSEETGEIRRRMMEDLPEANEGLFGAGEDYIGDTLAGSSRNPLVDRATTAADDIAVDPRLAAFQDALMGDLGVGGGSSSKTAPARAQRFTPSTEASRIAASSAAPGSIALPGGFMVAGQGGGGGGGAAVPGNVGGTLNALATGGDAETATGTNEALRKLIAGELPAGWQGAEDAISRRVNEERAGNIRELRARAAGSNFYGGDLYKELETGAIAKGDQALTDELATKRYDAFQNALGLGSQFDLGALGLASDRELGLANIAAGERAAGASAGAAAADTASREKMAKYGFLMDALGLGETSRFGKAGQLGDLAGLVSTDQRAALGGVGDVTSGRRADLGVAGDLSLGADANRNAFRASENSLAGTRAGVNLGRAELGFQREQFYDPLRRISAFEDIMNQSWGPYGSETTTGRDTRSSPAPAFASPVGAGLSGAAVGGQIGSQYKGKGYLGQQPGPG